ncbi:RNA polymerase sigma factor [Microbulbifer thermotolerans]|uniref:RNA polymerase sigma factor n=1 Tax=Microbulbifer thermotolerans TaxID=252514 RepID=UPI000AB9913E|nr:sigma-70 family RNA polymerase sigma factor [Microbulbifer thermotolerans]
MSGQRKSRRPTAATRTATDLPNVLQLENSLTSARRRGNLSRKDYRQLSDESLLDYYHSTRNIKAFRELYARHKDCLYRYCVQMDPAVANEVLEILWNGLLEHPPQLSGRLLRSWLFIQVNKLLRNHACQNAQAPRRVPPAQSRALQGIQQLPRIERNILLLHIECALPLATVADIERISLKRCKEHYRRGKEKLEEFLYGPQRQPWRLKAVEGVAQ